MSAIGFKYKPSEKARSIGGGKRYALVFLRRRTTRRSRSAMTATTSEDIRRFQ